ncbi:MAG: 4-hydroxythreonine-4-phosphate dehydrogenase PdxA, partial [Limisphaerales bacterium]
ALKILSTDAQDSFQYLLLGDAKLITGLNESMRLGLRMEPLRDFRSDSNAIFYTHTGPNLPCALACGSSIAAESAMAALTEGAKRSLAGELDGIVTAPVNKESIIRWRGSSQPFMGQTEYLSGLAGTDRTAMMLLGADDRERWLRVALVTTHVPLRSVADHLSIEKIVQTIELAAQACRDLGLERARVAVCGLNPHAGEGGEIGTEEIKMIAPAVATAKERGMDVIGPLAADTLFYYAFNGHYDAVVAMYHDQGLVPLKMIGFESGINWTLGLPFIRTSPDHGTAYDIAGKNKANPESMLAAIKLARRLALAKTRT